MLSPAALVEAFSRRAQTVPSFEKFSAPSGDDADTAEEVSTPNLQPKFKFKLSQAITDKYGSRTEFESRAKRSRAELGWKSRKFGRAVYVRVRRHFIISLTVDGKGA